MKYLAAYALLALSGKKDICTSYLIQPLRILKLFSAVSSPTHLTMTSTKSSQLWRENLSINSLLKDNFVLVAVDLLQVEELQRLPKRRRLLKNNNPRKKKNQRRKKSPKSKKMKIWEVSSIDCSALSHHILTIINQRIKQYFHWIQIFFYNKYFFALIHFKVFSVLMKTFLFYLKFQLHDYCWELKPFDCN